MRISDWSSDVCSSDLLQYAPRTDAHRSVATGNRVQRACGSRCDGPREPRPWRWRAISAIVRTRLIAWSGDVSRKARHAPGRCGKGREAGGRSEENTSELQQLLRTRHDACGLKTKSATNQIHRLRTQYSSIAHNHQ